MTTRAALSRCGSFPATLACAGCVAPLAAVPRLLERGRLHDAACAVTKAPRNTERARVAATVARAFAQRSGDGLRVRVVPREQLAEIAGSRLAERVVFVAVDRSRVPESTIYDSLDMWAGVEHRQGAAHPPNPHLFLEQRGSTLVRLDREGLVALTREHDAAGNDVVLSPGLSASAAFAQRVRSNPWYFMAATVQAMTLGVLPATQLFAPLATRAPTIAHIAADEASHASAAPRAAALERLLASIEREETRDGLIVETWVAAASSMEPDGAGALSLTISYGDHAHGERCAAAAVVRISWPGGAPLASQLHTLFGGQLRPLSDFEFAPRAP